MQKSYRRDVFNEDYQCGHSKEEIEAYLQILMPIYQCSLVLQSKSTNISQVIPLLLAVIFGALKKLTLTDEIKKNFANKLSFLSKKNLILSSNQKFIWLLLF